MKTTALATMLALATPATAAQTAPAAVETVEPRVTALFETWMREQHVSGLVYGIVRDGGS